MPALAPVLELFQRRAKILAFHGVEISPGDVYEISREQFALQMQHLADQGYRVIGLDEHVDRLRTGKPLDRSIVITFDDGYASVIDNALPVLQRLGFTATVFLPTGKIGMAGPEPKAGVGSRPGFMSWQDATQLRALGFLLGGHTMNHRDLTRLTTEQAEEEICGSLQHLRAHFRQEFMPFAYPYGQYNSATAAQVKQAGFDCACGYGDILGNSRLTDPYLLRRESIVQTTDLREFSRKLDPGRDAARKLKSLIRGRARPGRRPKS